MKIYTSYFAKVKALESVGVVPIAICAKCPNWYTGLRYKVLAPSYDCLMTYKRDKNEAAYVQRFQEETLSKLSADDVIETLYEMSGGADVALICYEKPTAFCHRHLVANWLGDDFPTKITEWVDVCDQTTV